MTNHCTRSLLPQQPGIPGASHDSGIEKRSLFFRLADPTIPPGHYILGDSGYRMMRWQLTPYKAMHPGRQLTAEKVFYNYVHSSTRMVIERAFGRLRTRWRKLYKMFMRDQRTCTSLISSAFILHNFVEILEHAYGDLNPRFEQWPPAPRRLDPAVQLPGDDEMVELNAERDGLASYVHTMR
ncbi:MAG: transposase family protein [Devosia sp.]|nr:transposase family protein [Devosia sp.]